MRGLVKVWLLFHGGFFFGSYVIYVFMDSDKWFSRILASLACFGIWAVIDAIEKMRGEM
jgi:hypothetical protein